MELERFKLCLNEFHFELEVPIQTNPEITAIERYVIRELDGVGRENYSQEVSDNLKRDGDNIVGFKQNRGTSVALLQRCISRIVKKEDGSTSECPVTTDTLLSWGTRLLTKLSFKARELNDMLTQEDKKQLGEAGTPTPEKIAKND